MSKKIIDENLIRISGRIPIKRTIELGEEVIVAIKAGCVKKEILDNQDGTCNVVYVLRCLEAEFE